MKIVSGDLIQMALDGNFELIIHGCNCFCAMDAGIAKGIKHYFPTAYAADYATGKGDKAKLGTISFAHITYLTRTLTVVNAYTQYHWRGQGRKVDYPALRQSFRSVKQHFSGKKMGYPAIGAGLAGGSWNVIAEIIDQELLNEDHTFVKFSK